MHHTYKYVILRKMPTRPTLGLFPLKLTAALNLRTFSWPATPGSIAIPQDHHPTHQAPAFLPNPKVIPHTNSEQENL